MAYYVTSNKGYTEVDDREEANHFLNRYIEDAIEFTERMGWLPFWFHDAQIRFGKSGLQQGDIVSNTRKLKYHFRG